MCEIFSSVAGMFTHGPQIFPRPPLGNAWICINGILKLMHQHSSLVRPCNCGGVSGNSKPLATA